MSTATRTIRLFACALAIAAQAGLAYETPVHSKMTELAFTRSVQERDFLKDLGVQHFFAGTNLISDGWFGVSALDWARQGSVAEDSFIRSLFHFYDPVATGSPGLFGFFQAAPAFRGVGQFTHLLQDMAQPQHVRNDDHFSLTEEFYFLFPDYSRYEKRTLFQIRNLTFTGYPTVQLPTYRSYWNTSTGDRGLAQFTNLNFVSEKTNLDTGRYSSPSGTLLAEEVIPQVLDLRDQSVIATNVTVQYVSNSFTDPINGAVEINDRLSTFSLFDFQRMQAVGKHAYTLYNTNHDRYAELLIPRAVGYSAGLISRFFRGSLKIMPPNEGIYGIVDHSTIHQTDPVNGFVGFDTIKLKVLNDSPGGEALTGGRVVAVAKFHRNGCYKDDLSGEFSASGPACANFPTATEEIVVSSSIDNETIDRSTPKDFTFTFAQQIPINATDLYIQVVYRGAFGDDPDEVVVGTKDVFEPTFLAIFNSTDQILFNGVWTDTTSPSLLPALDNNNDGKIDAQYDRASLDIFFAFTDTFTQLPLGTIQQLPPARYSRMVVLTDRSPYPAPIQTIGVAFNTGAIDKFNPETNQLNFETNRYRVAVFSPLRGIPSWDSLTMYRSVPFQNGDLSLLPGLPDANKTPFPITTLTFKKP